MAQGDMIVFDDGLVSFGTTWRIGTDTFSYGLVDNTTTPTRDTALPHWGGTGTTNFATNQVSTGGTSYTGPIAMAGDSWSEAVANTFRLDFTDPSQLAQDASGPTDIYWIIVYNNTDTAKRCLCAIDCAGPISLTAGTFQWTVNANGIFQIT